MSLTLINSLKSLYRPESHHLFLETELSRWNWSRFTIVARPSQRMCHSMNSTLNCLYFSLGFSRERAVWRVLSAVDHCSTGVVFLQIKLSIFPIIFRECKSEGLFLFGRDRQTDGGGGGGFVKPS